MSNLPYQLNINNIIDLRGIQQYSLQDINSKIISHISEYVQSLDTRDQEKVWGARPGSKGEISDIDAFAKILANGVNMVQDLEGVNANDRIEVRVKNARIKSERDSITWQVVKRKPGLFEKGNIADAINSNKVREQTWHVRAIFDDPDAPGQAIVVFGKKRDNLIRLCVNSGDSNSAQRRAMWLENFMEDYTWYFHFNGVERLYFHEREEDKFEELSGNLIYSCPLLYYIRTEKLSFMKSSVLSKLIYNYVIKSQSNGG